MRRWDVLIEWIEEAGWSRGVELGVLKGDVFLRLLEACPRLSLVGVDIWEPRLDQEALRPVGGRSYAEHDLAAYETNLRSEARRFGERARLIKGWSVEVAREFPDGHFDFIFFDGDHTHGGLSSDINAWASKVRAGGALCGHDANNEPFPGVAAALNELLPGWTEHPDHVWRWLR